MGHTYLSENRSDNELLSDRLLSDEVRELYKKYPQYEWDILVDKIAKLEAENKWMRREVERVGHAIYTGDDGYVGTEEDLQAIGQSVEGICETLDHMIKPEAENEKLREWIDMFTIDHLEGMFNHYMEMQKQAFHGQSGESTIAFWHDRAKKQREIIVEFKALKLEADLEHLTTPTE